MEVHRLKNGVYLIDDTYNANPASMEEALKTLRTLKGECRSFIILGDMLELGVHSEAFHEEMGRLAAETEVHKIFLRGQFGSAVAEGAVRGGMKREHILQGHTNPEIIQYLKSALKEGDWFLVKGSRRTRMEDMVKDMIAEIGIAN
jgi:UDP-N-acetylmuramyl pentapeptide synthase